MVHMLFGAAIGSLVKNTPLAIAMAFLGHYFLDLFPHIEYIKSTEELLSEAKNKITKKHFADVAKVLFDFLAGLSFVFLFSKNSLLIYICAFVSIIPDGLTVVNSLFPNKITRKHHEIHGGKVHYFTKNKKSPLFWRVFTQVSAALASIIALKL